jgi:tRNA pseudouridine38-40 synthase
LDGLFFAFSLFFLYFFLGFPRMARLKLTLEYEGTRYSGWQVQKNARTVQGDIMGALSSILDTRDFEFYGSGRTDSGVHALAQVAHLDAQTMLAPHILRMKLNDNLPADINILSVEKTHKAFHARHDAVSRQYLYQVSRRRSAFGKRFVWWIKDSLDIESMRKTADIFTGLRDFRSFTADDPEEKSTKSRIEELRLEEHGSLILIRVRGSHFLWKMVRQMVGVMAEVGRGNMDIGTVHEFFEQSSGIPATLTAPPSGLFLERVYYNNDRIEEEIKPMLPVS